MTHPQEPLYSVRGGARYPVGFGWMGATWPFASFKVYPEHLEVFGSPIPRSAVVCMRDCGWWFDRGLRVERRNPAMIVEFYPFDLAALKRVLVEHGYAVQD